MTEQTKRRHLPKKASTHPGKGGVHAESSSGKNTNLKALIQEQIALLQQEAGQAEHSAQVTTSPSGSGESNGGHSGENVSAASGGKNSSKDGISMAELRQMIQEALQQRAGESGLSQGASTAAQSSSEPADDSQGSSSGGLGMADLKTLMKKTGSGALSNRKSHGWGDSGASKSSGEGAATGSSSKKGAVQPKTNASSEQTVAQVLTQAQYELSQELEENLTKLRSVIQQSQEIAKKIELVLGHGEKGSGSNQ